MDRFQRLLGAVLRGSLPVRPCTQGNDNFVQVAHDIVGPLVRIHHQDRSALRGQCRFQVLESEAHQPVGMLDQDDADLRITEQPDHAFPMALQSEADLLDDLEDRQPFA